MSKTPKDDGLTKIWDSIYRQWMWADHLRDCFGNALPDKSNSFLGNFTIETYWMFMSLWCAVLFTVLEALKENRIKIPEVQNEIDQMYQILKRYRNAVFHVQPKYWTKKWRDLILDNTSAYKIQKIHKQVGIFLLNTLKKRFLK